ncbi:hypothetical protein EJ03DRAFT_329627 [Teratosphaeria nubilosa]|uniref:MAPEG-domain-containing protein n=1 Tax=Teratosphaeria nubilosa TaxID=161662 RepID=A0A6G1L223_9PEZI|nr:hypothetical protein EJ03DRAFT_329627 [Teratosphaeria nubilosa]
MSASDRAQDKARDAAQDSKQAAVDAKEAAKAAGTAAKEDAQYAARRTKEESEKAAQKTKEKAQEAEQTLVEKLRQDGVENPAGLAMGAFSFLFLAAVPVTSFIAQPNGLLERAVNGVIRSVAFVGSAGSNSQVSPTGKIAALSTLYIAWTYAFSGAGSAAGQASAREEGRDNKEPRSQISSLRGLPLRLYSAHSNLMEMFPGYALAAALTQAIAPGEQGLVNLLGLHVISKVFVYYPAYLLNFDAPRTLAHVVATASVINVALRLSKRTIAGNF